MKNSCIFLVEYRLINEYFKFRVLVMEKDKGFEKLDYGVGIMVFRERV